MITIHLKRSALLDSLELLADLWTGVVPFHPLSSAHTVPWIPSTLWRK